MLTKKQEKTLKWKMKQANTKGIYICEDCDKRLIGLNAVHHHVKEKKHYSYTRPGMGRIGFL